MFFGPVSVVRQSLKWCLGSIRLRSSDWSLQSSAWGHAVSLHSDVQHMHPAMKTCCIRQQQANRVSKPPGKQLRNASGARFPFIPPSTPFNHAKGAQQAQHRSPSALAWQPDTQQETGDFSPLILGLAIVIIVPAPAIDPTNAASLPPPADQACVSLLKAAVVAAHGDVAAIQDPGHLLVFLNTEDRPEDRPNHLSTTWSCC